MSSSRPYRQLSEETDAPSASASTASIAFHLMYESAQHLEARGDRVAAAELLARALAEEAQRINQAEQSALDLAVDGHADLSVDLSKRATNQLRPLGELRILTASVDDSPWAPLCRAIGAQCFGVAPPAASTARAGGATDDLPPPMRTLRRLAERWHLPVRELHRLWADFLRASGGRYTLSPGRARQTVLAGLPPEAQHAAWELMMTDRSAAELMTAGGGMERRDSRADGGGGSLAGAGGLGFEDYLAFRCFVAAPTLSDQFRFLWWLLDRDRDGAVGEDDLEAVLQVQKVRLGWDDAYVHCRHAGEECHHQFQCAVHHALGEARRLGGASEGANLRPAVLREALTKSPELRVALMCAEPKGVARGGATRGVFADVFG